MSGSLILRNACRISDESEPLGMRLTVPFVHVRNNGLSLFSFSGGTCLEPFCLCWR